MTREFLGTSMAEAMKDNGRRITCMGMEHTPMRMEKNILANTKRIRRM